MKDTYTQKEVFRMLKKAFHNGRNWGETYQGWFSPTEKEHIERSVTSSNQILKKL